MYWLNVTTDANLKAGGYKETTKTSCHFKINTHNNRSLTKCSSVDHVKDTSRGADNYVNTLAESGHVLPHIATPNTSMTLHPFHVISNGQHHFLAL